MGTYRELKSATTTLDAWYFAANLSEDGKPWHAGAYPGPYRIFALNGDGCLGHAYFADARIPVVIAGQTIPAAVLSAATRLPLGLGCYLGPSGELCNGLGQPALVPVGSEACPRCNGNRCVFEEAVGGGVGRWTFCEWCGGLGWVGHAEPPTAPGPAGG
ncbi:MAG: hypothetical protein J2P46_06820 [Zavarzinella sp.]|nr:hypothetical protein [Zavarzinella sp.]